MSKNYELKKKCCPSVSDYTNPTRIPHMSDTLSLNYKIFLRKCNSFVNYFFLMFEKKERKKLPFQGIFVIAGSNCLTLHPLHLHPLPDKVSICQTPTPTLSANVSILTPPPQ